MHHILFIHSTADGHLSCSRVSAIGIVLLVVCFFFNTKLKTSQALKFCDICPVHCCISETHFNIGHSAEASEVFAEWVAHIYVTKTNACERSPLNVST